MFVGRSKELESLEEFYRKTASNLLVMYGHKGIGKTSLMFRFSRDKKFHYYCARPCSEEEQMTLWEEEIRRQGSYDTAGFRKTEGDGFGDILRTMVPLSSERTLVAVTPSMGVETGLYPKEGEGFGKEIIAIDEFQNILKYSETFMVSLLRYIKESKGRVMVVLLSSSVSFIENDFVPRIGTLAFGISSFVKMTELTFIDCVRYFENADTATCMQIYSILGGNPGYWSYFNDRFDIRENICQGILKEGAWLRDEGLRVVSSELRELNVYCTILNCLANGKNKLNDLHQHTGFSRAKISVYIKNLMERELVEKVFPFDGASNANAKKGMYRIKVRLLQFYFRFLYPNQTFLERYDAKTFFDRFVKDGLAGFHQENFPKVCTEFLELQNEQGALPIEAVRNGEWIGKEGSIDIIMQSRERETLLGFCNWEKTIVSEEDLEGYMKTIESAKLHPDYVYLFSAGEFSKGLKEMEELNDSFRLIDIGTI